MSGRRHMHKLALNLQGNNQAPTVEKMVPLSSGSINVMDDSIDFDRAYTLYSDPSSEKRSPSLKQPRSCLTERSIEVTLPVVSSWWWPPVLVEWFSHNKRSEKCNTYVNLEAFAGASVQPISGFLLNTTTWNSLSITTCCFCLIWKMLQLCGEKCQPTWARFSRGQSFQIN